MDLKSPGVPNLWCPTGSMLVGAVTDLPVQLLSPSEHWLSLANLVFLFGGFVSFFLGGRGGLRQQFSM